MLFMTNKKAAKSSEAGESELREVCFIFLCFLCTTAPSGNPQRHSSPPCSFTPLRYVKRQGEVATLKSRAKKTIAFY